MDDALSYLKKGVQYHVSGRLKEAETIYRQVLDIHPDHPDALNLLGLIANASGKNALAEQLIERAISISPSRPDYVYNLGVVSSALGKTVQAISAYEKSIILGPKYPDPHVNLGVIFERQGKLDQAIAMFEKAISLKPDFSEALYNLGNALYARGDIELAMDNIRKAVHYKPDYYEAWFNLGVMLRRVENFDESETCFRKVIIGFPGHGDAYFQLGLICYVQGRKKEAFDFFKETVHLMPNHVKALNNVGHLYQDMGEYDQAILHYKEAIRHDANDSQAHFNLGTAFQFRGLIKEAYDAIAESLSLMPDNPSAVFTRGEILLTMGKFEDGFRDYQSRLKIEKWQSKYQPLPGILPWDGSSLNGKTILVRGEQGFGDTIQFARYLPMVKEKGGHVLFEIKQPVMALFENYPGVDRLVLKSSFPDLSGIDSTIHLLSLPYLFKTTLSTIPDVLPFQYDRSKRNSRQSQLLTQKGKKVGFVWKGAPVHLNDQNRSCDLSLFSSVFDIKGITFFSLQKGEASRDLHGLGDRENVIDLSPEIDDFLDTALAIEQLDLVITVDTSVAHLSGTLEKPTWVLIPFSPDFRWLLSREDSPWYPSIRLFRQSHFGKWDDVFMRIRDALLSET